MINDQVQRFDDQTCKKLHRTINHAVVIFGFSIIGIFAGILVAVFFGPFGTIFQICKIFWLLLKALFLRKGIKDDDEDELGSPTPTGFPNQLSP